MTPLPRQVSQIVLIGALPVAMLAVMGALVAFNAYAFTVSPWDAAKIAIGVLPTVLVLGRGLWILLAERGGRVHGVPVPESEQPELWALVRTLARAAGTAPPDEIRLTAEANAAVAEDTRLLGLIATRRRMYLGAPLIASLSAPRLAAVITHELAHYGNRDTRLSAGAYRSRLAFTRTMAAMNRDDLLQRALHFLLRHYGTLVLRSSARSSRRQERAADEAAAVAVGSAETAAAFRELAPISRSWAVFTGDHLVYAWGAGHLPADVFYGYRAFRAALGEEPDEPFEEADPYDTHPPMAERIAAVTALRASGAVRVPTGDALDLLRDPALLDAAVLDALPPQARDMRRVDWPTLARVGDLAALREHTERVLAAAARLTGRPPSPHALLDALDAGLLAELGASRGDGIGDADPPRVRRERARLWVQKGLYGAVVKTLTGSGAVHWRESWPSAGTAQLDERYGRSLPELVDAAVSERPDTAPLRALLDAAAERADPPKQADHPKGE